MSKGVSITYNTYRLRVAWTEVIHVYIPNGEQDTIHH